jgi:AmmeMemoRadiSam system protein B
MSTRRADFAGSWYPDEPTECEREIKRFLKEGGGIVSQSGNYRGGIVPHAGWTFSGSIACNVIQALSEGVAPEVVVVFGMHLHEKSACYIMTGGAWDTPFGEIQIHETLAEKLVEHFNFEVETARYYNPDNTIELQLPFIKYFFPNTTLLPIGVPPTHTSLEIGRAVVASADNLGLTLRVIGSTDLTHYGRNYGFTSQGSGKKAVDWVKNTNDRHIIDAMLAMDPEKVISEGLANKNACCAGAAATAIAAAKSLGATRALNATYATSYDKSPGDSFVGYVGMVFE